MKTNGIKGFSNKIKSYLQLDEHEYTKLLFSTAVYFFLICAYSILRSLKTAVFMGMVGREYEPLAKLITILVTIPVMLFHGKIVDTFRRHQTVYIFIGSYAIGSLIFAYLFFHPVYGVGNTQVGAYRVTGWCFEFFMDLFQALLIGTFWSFINSISTPTFATRTYGLIVSGSRIGGILAPALGLLVLEKSGLASTTSIPLLTVCSALFLFAALYFTYKLKTKTPDEFLLGYEKAHTQITIKKTKKGTGALEGLWLMLSQPYVLGIFGLVFSFEIINILFDYQMHVLMSIEASNRIDKMSSFMFIYTICWQALSFIFAFFGTSTIVKKIGVPASILVMPCAAAAMALLPMFYPKLISIFIVMIVMRALNYGFNQPLREMLFIPTSKDIQFKSKAWIESFGRTISKTSGSSINMFALLLENPYLFICVDSIFSVVIGAIWFIMAVAIGRKYTKTIKDDQVIGQ